MCEQQSNVSHLSFYNNCLTFRALIGSFLSSVRVQTNKILILKGYCRPSKAKFCEFFFFFFFISKILILSLVKKNKSFNEREISRKNYFGEDLINN